MKDAHKLLALFYRLHFALKTGLSPRYGYGNRDEEIAAGKMPTGDIFDGNHGPIYSTALNLHAKDAVVRDGTEFAKVYVAYGHRNDWKVYVSCASRGQLNSDDAALFSDALAHAVKAAKACEEILKVSTEFDMQNARSELEVAIQESWKAVGEEGDPDDALVGAWRRINA